MVLEDTKTSYNFDTSQWCKMYYLQYQRQLLSVEPGRKKGWTEKRATAPQKRAIRRTPQDSYKKTQRTCLLQSLASFACPWMKKWMNLNWWRFRRSCNWNWSRVCFLRSHARLSEEFKSVGVRNSARRLFSDCTLGPTGDKITVFIQNSTAF